MKQAAAMRPNQGAAITGVISSRAQVPHGVKPCSPRFPDVDLAELQQAWRDIMRRAKLVQHHRITRAGGYRCAST